MFHFQFWHEHELCCSTFFGCKATWHAIQSILNLYSEWKWLSIRFEKRSKPPTLLSDDWRIKKTENYENRNEVCKMDVTEEQFYYWDFWRNKRSTHSKNFRTFDAQKILISMKIMLWINIPSSSPNNESVNPCLNIYD